MSIQDTIKKLQATNIPADLLIQVTNLIRAGAEMRKSKGIWEMEDACEAWDAALKGEESV